MVPDPAVCCVLISWSILILTFTPTCLSVFYGVSWVLNTWSGSSFLCSEQKVGWSWTPLHSSLLLLLTWFGLCESGFVQKYCSCVLKTRPTLWFLAEAGFFFSNCWIIFTLPSFHKISKSFSLFFQTCSLLYFVFFVERVKKGATITPANTVLKFVETHHSTKR